MQEQNPNLQEHVVVLEELQYSESDESDEDFDEGEAEELERVLPHIGTATLRTPSTSA